MSQSRIVIELSKWTQGSSAPTRRSVRRNAVANCWLGGVLIVAALAGTTVRVLLGPTWELLGMVFLAGAGAVAVWNGVCHLRGLRDLPPGTVDDPVPFAAPHAFAIKGNEVVFPSAFGRAEERWPLACVSVSVVRRFGHDWLRLSCPGFQTRKFPARSFDAPLAMIERIIAKATSLRGS